MAGRSRRQVCRASSGATEIFYFLIFFFFLFFSPKSSSPARHELEDTATGNFHLEISILEISIPYWYTWVPGF